MGNQRKSKQDVLTIFFVKPHIIQESEEIFKYLKEKITNPEDFNIMSRKRFPQTPKEFWRDFYSHLEKKYPKELEKMATEFTAYNTGIDLALITGEQIAQRVKEITGPTRYEDNPDYTIRGHFGPYELPNTIVHASDKEQVTKELKILKDYFPIHISL